MERSNQQGAQRGSAVLRPVTERQLLGYLASRGATNPFVLRLIETLRQAWARIQELEEAPKRDEQEAVDFAGREKVLAISETDGTVEIYAPQWVQVKHLEVKPWQEREQVLATLSADWRRLETEPNSRALIVPQIRPQLTDETLARFVIWERRSALMEVLTEALRK